MGNKIITIKIQFHLSLPLAEPEFVWRVSFRLYFLLIVSFWHWSFHSLNEILRTKTAPPQNLKFGSKYLFHLSVGNYSCSCITYWFTRWNTVLKCKILRRLDLTSRLKIEYLAGHQTEIFFEKLYSNSIKRMCLYTCPWQI